MVKEIDCGRFAIIIPILGFLFFLFLIGLYPDHQRDVRCNEEIPFCSRYNIADIVQVYNDTCVSGYEEGGFMSSGYTVYYCESFGRVVPTCVEWSSYKRSESNLTSEYEACN